jgi:hypothetical protein
MIKFEQEMFEHCNISAKTNASRHWSHSIKRGIFVPEKRYSMEIKAPFQSEARA